MKEIRDIKVSGLLAIILITALCFTTFFPVIIYADKAPEAAEDVPGTNEITITEELPDYALLPDGRPNPAFIDADGKLFTVSPVEYAEIVAAWMEPGFDMEEGPTVLELLGHIPGDPVTESEPKGDGSCGAAEPKGDGSCGACGAAGAGEGDDPEKETDPEEETGPGEETEHSETGVQAAGAGIGAPGTGIVTAFAGVTAAAVDFPYFFHIANQMDPYGSGHHYRQYYVPAGSDVPQLSFCLEMGKNAPPDSVKVAYTPMGAPSWATALATNAPTILRTHSIDTATDNPNRYWAMQNAVWKLMGSPIGGAAGTPVIESLVAAAKGSVTESNPDFNGITHGGVLRATIYDDDHVRYGPFSITGMIGTGSMSITTADGRNYPDAVLVDANGNTVSRSSIPGGRQLYIIMPRYLNETQQISVRLNAPYVLPTTMSAYAAPSSSYQNQIVMPNWVPKTGTLYLIARLGGFGNYEFTKLDAGWQNDYLEMDYDGDGAGDIYQLEGAMFKIQQWNGSSFADTSYAVTYDPDMRLYRTDWLTETTSNGGRFRIVETTIPYGYRDPVIIEFSIRGKYDLFPGAGLNAMISDIREASGILNNEANASYYILNSLLNIRIEIGKRDSADEGAGPALPQGGATLEGAYYGLFYAEDVKDPSGIERAAGELVCIGITDENGRIVFDNSDAEMDPAGRKLIWSNSNLTTNYGTADFPIYLPEFERQDRRIYPALYYIQELVPSRGYLLDVDPETAELDANGVPLPGTGPARKYEADARDDGVAKNPIGIRVETSVTEKVKKRGFLLRKIRSNGNESEVLNLNGAGFSVYFIEDLIDIMKKAALENPEVKVPQRGPGGWDKQDFLDFFYEADYVHPITVGTGKDWYDHEAYIFKGRYNFDLYPDLKRARIDYIETPVFYSGAATLPGFSYGEYGNTSRPRDGEVVFPEFPYGEYIVFETYVPPGVDRIKPFVVNIAEDGGDVIDGDGRFDRERPEQGWRLQVDSDMFSIRLWKKDAETGRIVIGKEAAYRIKYLGADGVEGGGDDRWVEMVVPVGSGSVRWGTEANPFRVGADGVLILPKKLQAGSYKLYEVEAPSGYVLSYHEAVDGGGYYSAPADKTHKHGWGEDDKAGDKNYVKGHYILYTPVSKDIVPDPQPDVGIVFDANEAHRVTDFDIDEDGYDDFVLELIQYNEQQKGRIDIHKERELHEESGPSPGTIMTAPLPGVRFELYAAEDILSLDGHGFVLFEKGELVASAVTDAEGNAYIKDLYLGLYLLKEADIDENDKTYINGKLISGYGFVDEIEIDLRPPAGAGPDDPFHQENPFIAVSFDMLDTWQLGRVEVKKLGRQPGETGVIEEPLAGVVFEVIARADILCVNTGAIIWKKGDVIGTIVTGEEGTGRLGGLLPGDYLLRETEAPEGYTPIEDKAFTISPREHTAAFEWYAWDLINVHRSLLLTIAVEVDKDTIKRTSAAFVSLPGQAGYNNVGAPDERYRYDVNFRSTSSTWADEFVVDDPLENAVHEKIVVEELWTPVVWGDYDGLWNLWYGTNKTDNSKTYSGVSAMDTNPDNPDNPERIAAYPNTGLKLLAAGLRTDLRYHFTLDDFGLEEGEYLTHLRYEYGRVEVGFTSKNYSSKSSNGEHRKISGKDLKLPSDKAGELMLLDPGSFAITHPEEAHPRHDDYTTGIIGDVVDWTPQKKYWFYAAGAAEPGYELKPASYLVSATKAMVGVDIVSSVSARIARNVTIRAYDQDAVVTREIGTFEYKDQAPGGGSSARTFDAYPLLGWLLVILSASIGLLVIARVTMDRRSKARRQRG